MLRGWEQSRRQPDATAAAYLGDPGLSEAGAASFVETLNSMRELDPVGGSLRKLGAMQPPLTQFAQSTSVRRPISPGKEIAHISAERG